MTICIGYRDPTGAIWLGADSRASNGGYIFQTTVRKIVKTGAWFAAVAGRDEILQLMRENSPYLAGAVSAQDYGARWIELQTKGAFKREDTEKSFGPPSYGHSLLLARGDQLWDVSSTGSPAEPLDGFVAIGSGATHAEGAAYAFRAANVSLAPEKIVRICLEAAVAHWGDCGGELNIVKVDCDPVKFR